MNQSPSKKPKKKSVARRFKLIASAFIFSLYFQGLGLYFYITGLINFKPTWLTAAYQIFLLATFLLIVLSIHDSRKNFSTIGFIELAYIAFFIIVSFDLQTPSSPGAIIPENVFIYFIVYSISLALGRALIFEQLTLVCYFTNFISVITSILLVLQFLIGSSSFLVGRLFIGSSGNPILAGYVGAYAFITSIILLGKSKSLLVRLIFIGASLPGLIVALLSGTRSSLIFISVCIAIGSLISLIIKLKAYLYSSGRSLMKPNTGLIFCFNTSIIILIIIFFAPVFPTDNPVLSSIFGTAFDRTDQLFLIGSEQVKDNSLLERYSFYEQAIQNFTDSPMFGRGIYSSGYVHNSFLQSASDFGMIGVVTFTLPFLYLGYQVFTILKKNIFERNFDYFTSDHWMINTFSGVILIEAMCISSFHGDLYRSAIPLCILGILIAVSRLNTASTIKKSKKLTFLPNENQQFD
ncbi:MAG: O-antigen ligase family protein [Coleofasciculaceae cyanobacterium]